uniref:Uncharacterized protein n=1 Tax=Anguilla anguilla TaxID=7936 RepID=A0A0E9VJZ6_ANGAN
MNAKRVIYGFCVYGTMAKSVNRVFIFSSELVIYQHGRRVEDSVKI